MLYAQDTDDITTWYASIVPTFTVSWIDNVYIYRAKSADRALQACDVSTEPPVVQGEYGGLIVTRSTLQGGGLWSHGLVKLFQGAPSMNA